MPKDADGGAGGDSHDRAPRIAIVGQSSADAGRGSCALSVERLSVNYGDAVALRDVSFEIDAGKTLCVLGPNGAGKSSLARAISGLVRPSEGRITFGGSDISTWSADRIRRAGVVHLPESRGVFRSLTVIENLRMGADCLGGRRARREAVERALEMFPDLASRRRQLAALLSGGQQQMLSLARVLASFPKLLLADEISLGLAPQMVDLVFDGLQRATQAGVTVVMVEQYVHRALEFADECVVLQHGELVWKGPAIEARGELLRHYLGEGMVTAG